MAIGLRVGVIHHATSVLIVGLSFFLSSVANSSPPIRVWYSEPYGTAYANGQGPAYRTAQEGCAHFNGQWGKEYTYRYEPNPPGNSSFHCRPYYNGTLITDPYWSEIHSFDTRQKELCFDPVKRTGTLSWTRNPNLPLADQCQDLPAETPKSCPVGNPISPLTGQKIQLEQPDFRSVGPHPLEFQRIYRSDLLQYGMAVGAISSTWFHNWQRSLNPLLAGEGIIMARRGDATLVRFSLNGSLWTRADGQSRDYISAGPNESGVGAWQYHVADTDAVEAYDADGRLLSVTERNGWKTTLTYSTKATTSIPWGGSGVLESVRNQFGATLSFSYDNKNVLISVTTPDGNIIKYGVAADGARIVTWPDGTVRKYHYGEDIGGFQTALPGRLTGITDELGVRYSRYNYNTASGFVIGEEHAGGVDKLSFSYGTNATTVTDGSGATRTFNYQMAANLRQPTGATGSSPIGDPFNTIQYDASNNISRTVDRNGSDTRYSHDVQGRETQRIEGYATPDAKTTTTEWHPTWNLRLKVAAPGQIESFTYDAKGQTTSYTSYATIDQNGALGLAAPQAAQSTGMRWEYDTNGLVVAAIDTVDNVDNARWTYTYDAAGNLATLTNPKGKIGRVLSYDGAGRVLTAIDTSGLEVSVQYDYRGSVVKYQRGAEVVSYGYNAAGFLTTVAGPADLRYELEYDDAHRLVAYWLPADQSPQSVALLAENPFSASPTSVRQPQTRGGWLTEVWRKLRSWLSALVSDAHAQPVPALVRTAIATQVAGESGPGISRVPAPSPADVLEQGNGKKQQPDSWLNGIWNVMTGDGEAKKDNRSCIKKPAIPDVLPRDLCELFALAEAKAGAGEPRMGDMADEPRLIAHYGPGPWRKMQHKHTCFDGRQIVIHYFSNGRGLNVELKFVK